MDYAKRQIYIMCKRLGKHIVRDSSKLEENSIELYDELRQKGMMAQFRYEQDTIAASVVYTAGRILELPIQYSDVCDASSLDLVEKEIGKMHRKIKNKLELKIRPLHPGIFVERHCMKLGIGEIEKDDAERVIDEAGTHAYQGRNPSYVAAAAIFMVTDNYSQREIAKAAGTSDSVIKTNRKILS